MEAIVLSRSLFRLQMIPTLESAGKEQHGRCNIQHTTFNSSLPNGFFFFQFLRGIWFNSRKRRWHSALRKAIYCHTPCRLFPLPFSFFTAHSLFHLPYPIPSSLHSLFTMSGNTETFGFVSILLAHHASPLNPWCAFFYSLLLSPLLPTANRPPTSASFWI